MGRISQKKKNLKRGSIGMNSGIDYNKVGSIVDSESVENQSDSAKARSNNFQNEPEHVSKKKKAAEEKEGTIQHEAMKIGKAKSTGNKKK